MTVLPRQLRINLWRRMLRIPGDEQLAPITFKTAETRNEFEQAFTVLHDAYVEVGYQSPHPSGKRITVYHALPSTVMLIAKQGDEVLGTVSIVRDNDIGLPMEKAVDLTSIRYSGKTVCEISALSIKKEHRGKLFLPLMKYMYQFCVYHFGIEIMLATIRKNSRVNDLYQCLFCFEPIDRGALMENYNFANNQPVAAYKLEMQQALIDWSRLYSKSPADRNLVNYFTSKCPENFIFPIELLGYDCKHQMSTEVFDYFFTHVSETLYQLEEKELVSLHCIMRGTGYTELLPPLPAKSTINISTKPTLAAVPKQRPIFPTHRLE
ncbi:MAG: hypothetical protein PHC51_01200 [bacterium]|nr:hypothetical protein [bacterium]